MSLHNNNPVHPFNASYSDQDLINAVRDGKLIEAPNGCWNDLRMTRASLADVFSTPITQNSFGCRGVKRDKQSNLVMIKYDMSFQDDINWDTAKTKFQDFLHRQLNIDRSSIEIEGIVSGTETWYILEGTSALVEAIKNMLKESFANMLQESPDNMSKDSINKMLKKSLNDMSIESESDPVKSVFGFTVAVVAVAAIVVLVLKR